jgi:hypothetical protein
MNESRFTGVTYFCPECERNVRLLDPCVHVLIEPDALEYLRAGNPIAHAPPLLPVTRQREAERFEPELAVLLALAMEVVRNGGKLTLVGSGPLSPARSGHPRYEGTLTSHSGARGASGTGETLAQMLDSLIRNWGKL